MDEIDVHFLANCNGRGDRTTVNKMCRAVDALGYRRLVIKTGGEPVVLEVQAAVACARVHDIICEIHLHMIRSQTVGLKEQWGGEGADASNQNRH